jgi:hypothetical protein
MAGSEANVGIGMQDSEDWNAALQQRIEPLPWLLAALTAPIQTLRHSTQTPMPEGATPIQVSPEQHGIPG